jgi:hypothetical protein
MRNYFNLPIILFFSFLILLPLELKPQTKRALKNQPENSFRIAKEVFQHNRFIAKEENEILVKNDLPVTNKVVKWTPKTGPAYKVEFNVSRGLNAKEEIYTRIQSQGCPGGIKGR